MSNEKDRIVELEELRTRVAELESRLEAGCRDDEKQCVFLSEREELKKRVAELEKNLAHEESLYSQKKMECQLMDVENAKRLSTLEQSILDLSHPNIKNILSELNQYKSKTVNVVAFHKLEDRLSTLLKASEGMEKALERLVFESYSRSMFYKPSNDAVKQARASLADFRAVKETMEKGAGE